MRPPIYGTVEYLIAMSRFEEAIAESKRAAELEPYSLIVKTYLGVSISLFAALRRCNQTVQKSY